MKNTNAPSIYWHDYETFGANPASDRPAQFAGIRTDLDLNIVGEPETFYCRIAPDYLPAPEAIFVTGITPQLANSKGMAETEFMGRINEIFSQPNTCVAGYNSLRFDDEVTRYGFYRNFIDPYAREWQQGNSRWDIIDLVRACYALRPDGINWPQREDGSPSFKLEHLSAANGLGHEKAHDAMSDVYATISLARLIKEQQPRLFDYYFNLRKKQRAAELIDVLNMTPLVHVSSKIPATHGCVSLIAPLAYHPTNKNAIICVNLALDVQPLLDLDVEQLRERMYTARADLAEDEMPVGIKLVHLNKSPFIAPAKTLTDERAEALGFDKALAREQFKKLKNAQYVRQKLNALFETESFKEISDPDFMLYSGGFFSPADKAKMEIIRNTAPQHLAALALNFDDERLPEMLFRYRARNYPATLSDEESRKWQQFCQKRLNDPDYVLHLENLLEDTDGNEDKQKLLKALVLYLQSL